MMLTIVMQMMLIVHTDDEEYSCAGLDWIMLHYQWPYTVNCTLYTVYTMDFTVYILLNIISEYPGSAFEK